MPAQLHLLIFGKVQGVWYRASAEEQAKTLGLTGWVRNTPDGRVEIVAQGKEVALQTFKNWCQKGPRLAHVSRIEETKELIIEHFKTFEIR